MARPGDDLVLVDSVEQVYDVEVLEVVESLERLGVEALVEHDRRLYTFPVIVDRLRAPTDNDSDRVEHDVIVHRPDPSAISNFAGGTRLRGKLRRTPWYRGRRRACHGERVALSFGPGCAV